ncbi:MAG: hypothetical protein EB116_19655, partial [Betaproteobacteria bacterium]|nr:hypothetical protein [Betaproteobacteria bacterium]
DQFTVTRATTATRVNASGLIESVASGVLRLDYPIGGGCPAGLIEPAGTNFARNVQFMTGQDTPTASGGMTITTGSTDFLAPDGTSGSITKYVGGAASGASQYAYYSGTGVTVTASGQYTFSLFVKAGATNPLNFCALSFTSYTGGSGTSISYFSLASGTALTAGASIQDYGNGWYRLISAPYTIASGDLAGNVIFYQAEGNNDITWPASGALNLTAYTWGGQVETGAIPTSYIPTTTGSATRAAEVCTVSGVSGYIGQTQGTLYAEFEYRTDTSTRRILAVSDGSQLNRVFLYFAVGSVIASIQAGNLTVGTPVVGFNKVAFSYIQNGVSGTMTASLNGAAVVSGTSAAYPTSLTTINLGKIEDSGTTSQINSRIRAAAIYPTRLSNDELQNLTRLT